VVVAVIQSAINVVAAVSVSERPIGGIRIEPSVVFRRCQSTERSGAPGARIRGSEGINVARSSIVGS